VVGWLLDPGGKGTSSLIFRIANGVIILVMVLLSKTKLIVCGSATGVGLYQVTLYPSLICIRCGENIDSDMLPCPTPACIFVPFPVAILLEEEELVAAALSVCSSFL